MAPDEYGLEVVAPGDRMGWLGKQQRMQTGIANLTRMGVRLYDPTTGRFLQVDPIEGGNPNDFMYPADPVNAYDIMGTEGAYCSSGGACRDISYGKDVCGSGLVYAGDRGCVKRGALSKATSRPCSAGLVRGSRVVGWGFAFRALHWGLKRRYRKAASEVLGGGIQSAATPTGATKLVEKGAAEIGKDAAAAQVAASFGRGAARTASTLTGVSIAATFIDGICT